LNKRIVGGLIAAILILSIGVGASYAAKLGNSGEQGNSADHRQDGVTPVMKGNPHQFKQLKLMYATTSPDEDANWTHVPGNEVSGFKLCLNESIEWYYIDVMALKPYAPIADGMYAFYADPAQYPDDFKGALDGGDAVQQLLYDIFVTASDPIFYLRVFNGGTSYQLVDGFQYTYALEQSGLELFNTLRVDGTYPLGIYNYHGVVDGQDIAMQITFRACECEACVEE